jgi:hypothetical protein
METMEELHKQTEVNVQNSNIPLSELINRYIQRSRATDSESERSSSLPPTCGPFL